jgi:hypothetical protein
MAIRKDTHSLADAPPARPAAPAPAPGRDGVEWTAGPLRPVAHWVTLPGDDGRRRLQMIWEVPNPVASSALS